MACVAMLMSLGVRRVVGSVVGWTDFVLRDVLFSARHLFKSNAWHLLPVLVGSGLLTQEICQALRARGEGLLLGTHVVLLDIVVRGAGR